MPDTLTHLVHHDETINLMTSLHSDRVLVSALIHGTNPYERFGKQVIQDLYKRGNYDIAYSNTRGDRIYVHHTVGE